MTKIQEIINHYFETKGLDEEDVKEGVKAGEINYAMHLKPAKDLLELTDSLEEAKNAITEIADWAKRRGLDYNINTVIKRWIL